MIRAATALFALACTCAQGAELWTSEQPLANVHLRFSYEATKDGQIVVIAAPGATVTFPVSAGQSGTLEVGARQKKGEAGEIGAWRNGETFGDVKAYGESSSPDVPEFTKKSARFISTKKQAVELFEMGVDFTASARFRTKGNGTLFSRAEPGKKWLRDGKALYLRGGRLTYDVGWLGAVHGGPKVNDGKWHHTAVTSKDGTITIYLDGKKIATDDSFATPDPDSTRLQIGAAGTDFGGNFDGEISNVRFWKRALDAEEAMLAASDKIDETNTPDFNWTPQGLEEAPKKEPNPSIIDGFVAHTVTISGDATISKVATSALGEADHARLIRGWDHNALDRGARIYNGLCITCHGDQKVEGTLPTALRFHKGEFKNGKDPMAMYNTLTKGYNLMVAQAWMTPKQKWDVIHYIRESFLKTPNPKQYVDVDDDYLAALPRGLGTGPDRPSPFDAGEKQWKRMDYGPVQFWTIEVEPGNIAYKGIAVRLDEGPGGVAKGNKFILYDHDLMRVAAAWEGEGYINWRGIAFDQSHGSHAALVGDKIFANPVAPGVMSPVGEHEDPRFLGRDGKPYGPLPRDWTHYKGLYMHGNRPVLKYTIGDAEVLEMPGYEMLGDTLVITRTIHVGPGADPILRVAPEGTAVAAKGAKIAHEEGGMITAYLKAGSSCKLFIAKADQAALDGYVATAGGAIDLRSLLAGGPKRWPDVVTTEGKAAAITSNGFAADEITLPHDNPWNSWLRLGGFDFFPGAKRAAVASWLGDVFIVDGIGEGEFGEHRWKRIATGLFQPLGVRVVDGAIYVTCRDQIAKLHDLNGDEEIDYIESFNNDHQVTEHFHEFAMGLQTDDDGNFYYAKSARHAKTALVPHHGTLLKVSKDGSETKIIANGFRAANGVCLNPDGTFIVTDQEGHWNPKNRINYVKEGGFYGNMFGYHDVTDESDEAMDQPLCWITNNFDRSPGELMWVPENAKWGPLNGHLLNLSYGTGRIFLVPHEKIDGQAQGGMISLGLEFPTGIMRGRFHPDSGQLYASGMFAWAGSKRGDGGFYRIRYTGENPHLPSGLEATADGVRLTYTGALDAASVQPGAFNVEVWNLKRTKNYGSKHYDQRRLEVSAADISADGKSVSLTIPLLEPTWGMEIQYKLKAADGESVEGKLHNSIHQMP